eukprot:TRINITY_DN43092_c0_g1_i1.p2 TRINITY_DN43092_c0_g1~~TRINITY_DN43092_c0_g1_i1.p2  ORF type:complete len:121 (-),score=28.00 TRINITY_DN43092_c0_g1_i1:80-442(-)
MSMAMSLPTFGGVGKKAMIALVVTMVIGGAQAISIETASLMTAIAIPTVIVGSIVTGHLWLTFFIGLFFLSLIVFAVLALVFAAKGTHTAKDENEGIEREKFEKMPFHKQVLRRRRQHTQ